MRGGTLRRSDIARQRQRIAVGNRDSFLVEGRRRNCNLTAAERNPVKRTDAGNFNQSFAAGFSFVDNLIIFEHVARAEFFAEIFCGAAGNFPVRGGTLRRSDIARQRQRIAVGNRDSFLVEGRRRNCNLTAAERNPVKRTDAGNFNQSFAAGFSFVDNLIIFKHVARAEFFAEIFCGAAGNFPVRGGTLRRSDIARQRQRIAVGNRDSFLVEGRRRNCNLTAAERNPVKRTDAGNFNQSFAAGFSFVDNLIIFEHVARAEFFAEIFCGAAGNFPVRSGTFRRSDIARKLERVAVGNRDSFLIQRRRRQSYLGAADGNIFDSRAAVQAGNRNFSFAAAGRHVINLVVFQHVAGADFLGNVIRNSAGNFPVRRRRTRFSNVPRERQSITFAYSDAFFAEHGRVQSHDLAAHGKAVERGAALKPADSHKRISAAGRRVTNAPRVAHKVMTGSRTGRRVNRHRAAHAPVSWRCHRLNDVRAERKRVARRNVNRRLAQNRFAERDFRAAELNPRKCRALFQVGNRNQRVAGRVLISNTLRVRRKYVARRRARAKVSRRRAGNIPVSRRCLRRRNVAGKPERVVAADACRARAQSFRRQSNYLVADRKVA